MLPSALVAESSKYRFGGFTLEPDTRRLRCGARVVPLVPKAFDLLVLLVEARPRVLTKEDLHRRLWPNTYVSDGNLSGLVALIREALGDDARKPRVIRTVHRIGYAFFGSVESDRRVEPPRATASTSYWLTLPNRQLALSDGDNVIGRDPEVSVPLQFPGVSRRHARIVIFEGIATIHDLGSKNGTWVRGERLTAPCVLQDGDELRVGSMLLTFRAATQGRSATTETVNLP